MSDTQKIVYEEWKKAITLELSKKEIQTDLQKVVTKGPSEYREAVERSEKKLESGEMTIEEERSLKDRVNKRMMSESPALIEYKLRNDGGKLIPNFKSFEREKRRKEFYKW